MHEFIAKFAYAGDDDGVRLAGLADDRDETTRYLLFQKTVAPSEQDIALGQDVLYVSLHDPVASLYGGIESIRLRDDELRLDVSEEAAAALGTGLRFSVGFDPRLNALDAFAAMLATMSNAFLDERSRRSDDGVS